MIYLDEQATTPLAPEAREAMLPWLTADGSANPHSAHVGGRAAKAAIEVARDQVAALLPPGGRLIFTGGATEALNWALIGSRAQRIAVSAIEHAAVLDTARWLAGEGRQVVVMPVGRDGLISVDAVPTSVDLMAVMHVNNEVGTIQAVADLGARARPALVLCDAVQGYGKLTMPEGCDLIAISAHKIYGPKGIGALWIRDGVTLQPLLHGGGQEAGLRSGTLSPALCAGFGAAAMVAKSRMAADVAHVDRLWDIAVSRLGPAWTINGSPEARWKGNLNIRRAGLDGAQLISCLRDIAFSVGSACASGSGRPSHVLKALGLSNTEARSSIRLGFGRYTTEADLAVAVERIVAAADAQAPMAA